MREASPSRESLFVLVAALVPKFAVAIRECNAGLGPSQSVFLPLVRYPECGLWPHKFMQHQTILPGAAFRVVEHEA